MGTGKSERKWGGGGGGVKSEENKKWIRDCNLGGKNERKNFG